MSIRAFESVVRSAPSLQQMKTFRVLRSSTQNGEGVVDVEIGARHGTTERARFELTQADDDVGEGWSIHAFSIGQVSFPDKNANAAESTQAHFDQRAEKMREQSLKQMGESLPGAPSTSKPQLKIVDVSANDTLNLREAPDQNSRIVAKIPPTFHAIYAVGESQRNGEDYWIPVQAGQFRGYVNGKFVAATANKIAPSPPIEGILPGERFPETRVRRVIPAELDNLSADDLRYAINEMFARRGAEFQDRDLQSTFSRFSWYRPHPGTSYKDAEAQFSPLEVSNLKLLGQFRDVRRGTAKPIATPAPRERRNFSTPPPIRAHPPVNRHEPSLEAKTRDLDRL